MWLVLIHESCGFIQMFMKFTHNLIHYMTTRWMSSKWNTCNIRDQHYKYHLCAFLKKIKTSLWLKHFMFLLFMKRRVVLLLWMLRSTRWRAIWQVLVPPWSFKGKEICFKYKSARLNLFTYSGEMRQNTLLLFKPFLTRTTINTAEGLTTLHCSKKNQASNIL